MEIKIKNSKLKLVEKLTSDCKTRFRVFFDTTDCLNVVPTKTPTSNGFYLVSTGEKFGDDFEYSTEEKQIIAGIYKVLLGAKSLDVAETLCRALKNSQLFKDFYSLRESKIINENIDKFIASPESSIEETVKDFAPIYGNSKKYSVYELLEDLIKDKSEILITSSLPYDRISRLRVDDKATPKPVGETWCKVIGIERNNTRANVSLRYVGEISIYVPENESIGFPGETRLLKTIKSICIIKDGTLWTNEIGVRVNSGKLQRKLKNAGLVSMGLLHSNEFILNLTKTPLISKTKISGKCCYNKLDLANTEVKYNLCKLAVNYLEIKEYMNKMGLTVAPEKIEKLERTPLENYLAEYGIYGDTYYPKKLEDKSSKFYETTELVANISCFPKTKLGLQVYRHINGVCRYPIINTFLDTEIKPLEGKKSYPELIDSWNKKLKFYERKLKDLKLKAILSKKLPGKQDTTYEGLKININWKMKDVKVYV